MVSTNNPRSTTFGDAARPAESAYRMPPGAATSSTAGETPSKPARPEPYEPLLNDLAYWSALATHYVSAQTDLVKLKVRKAAMLFVAWLLGRIVLYVALAYAVWMVLRGISGGLTEAFGGRAWAGDLTTGFVFLAIVALAVVIGTRRMIRSSREHIRRTYEQHRPSRSTTARTSEKGFEHGTGI